MGKRKTPIQAMRFIAGLISSGCAGGDARVEMAAADALDALAEELHGVVQEYHADLSAADDARQGDMVAALVFRLRTDCGDDDASARHAADFSASLERLQQDRKVAQQRRGVAGENLLLLRDTADGLRRVGVASLSLEDEMKRYLIDLIAARQAADTQNRDRQGVALSNATPVRKRRH